MLLFGLYLLMTVVPLVIFIQLTMPPHVRRIKITFTGLMDAVYAQTLPVAHAIDQARKNN